VRAALAAGAHGYVGKRGGASTLLAGIRALSRGGKVEHAAPAGSDDATDEERLSAREREVLRLVVRGHTGREMASALGISKSSADTYRARLFRKLGVATRAELLSRVTDDVEAP
jgi:DNA-binding NarL/FixJ family response regulator